MVDIEKQYSRLYVRGESSGVRIQKIISIIRRVELVIPIYQYRDELTLFVKNYVMRKGYDTVNLFLFSEFLPANYNLSDYLEDAITVYDEHGEILYSNAKVKNLIISFNKRGLSVKNSLSTFYTDDLKKSFLGAELHQAIEILNDLLGVNLFKAKVTKLDFCFDIKTKYDPNTYFKFYGEKKRFKTGLYEDGKYYLTQHRKLVLYNKSKEAKIKDSFILRYEIRFAKSISKQFKIAELRIEHLCESEYIKNIEKLALSEYLSIRKYDNSIFNLNENLTSKKIDAAIYKAGIKSLGIAKIMDALTSSYLLGKCCATQKHRFKEKIHKINNLVITENTSLVDEIDLKLIGLVYQN